MENFNQEPGNIVATPEQQPHNQITKQHDFQRSLRDLRPLPRMHSGSLTPYVRDSVTLTQLVNLGVDLQKIEEHPKLARSILQMDFENDVKPRILFLNKLGVADSDLGTCISKNPNILHQDLQSLQVNNV